MSRYAHLTDEELAVRAKHDRDCEEALVHRFWHVARFEAKEFRILNTEQEDRHLLAMQGVVLGVRSWEPGKGTQVKSYVKRIIRRKLIDLARSHGRPSRRSDRESVSMDQTVTESGLLMVDAFEHHRYGEDSTVEAAHARILHQSHVDTLASRLERLMAKDGSDDTFAVRHCLSVYVRHLSRTGELSQSERRFLLRLLEKRTSQPLLFEASSLQPVGDMYDVMRSVIGGYISLETLVCEDILRGLTQVEVCKRHGIRADLFHEVVGLLRESFSTAA